MHEGRRRDGTKTGEAKKGMRMDGWAVSWAGLDLPSSLLCGRLQKGKGKGTLFEVKVDVEGVEVEGIALSAPK